MQQLGIIGAWQIILIVCGLVLPIIALIDVIRNEYTKNNKLIWVLVILLMNFLGALLYFLFGTSQKIKNN
ncbi:MAG: PLD nuclease N-terminal domain-containing protein [Allomuricauda sp.]|jgi:heme/copper-type cytochrome/quinol oxidase subunit 4|uniref:PLD nuclease N-terminal domain-containing protein n=1 Tax=Flagellimonas sp. MMG031 TaxID=3158549 RepID=A0AAU7N268_9FLAO|nr:MULTISPECIES: PLD nuclease N-terminal domain-containing protein [unclassified Allomuricauda]MBO6534337.1 PLDc_N domain-containing protein [Allomuricauda sp.]MBO6590481.1 PLDc_N domain-containing protein [Allomuricauda sp.]MBO6620062.1 PLDc_N domain-containing protein [Allomuricauda sp.]MBO6646002.1 PLDc_N domain-containing protein [Allomuricauda sp.]MBO6748400.1 PLDc_N domain-containing protein [Allomuricauda sp.]